MSKKKTPADRLAEEICDALDYGTITIEYKLELSERKIEKALEDYRDSVMKMNK